MFLRGMSNVLAEDKRQQVLALGRLGWSLRRIERATGVRRETASGYLKAAGRDHRVEAAAIEGRHAGADGAEAPVAACGGAPDQGTGEARRSGAGSRGSADVQTSEGVETSSQVPCVSGRVTKIRTEPPAVRTYSTLPPAIQL